MNLNSIGLIIGLLGIFIGIIIVLISFIIKGMTEAKNELLIIRQNIVESSEGLILPSANIFLAALVREWEFWAKLFINRPDKLAIAREIATNYINENDTVIIDSGTTIDQIPYMLNKKGIRVKIYTNNLLAAISVVPPIENVQCFLLPGRIDPLYGATYYVEKIEEPFQNIKAEKIILAATRITFDQGPMVKAKDMANRIFKQELVRKCILGYNDTCLIIAVDWSKFRGFNNKESMEEYNPVMRLEDWKAVKATKRFVLVTSTPPETKQTTTIKFACQIIDEFKKNMKRGGMQVVEVS